MAFEEVLSVFFRGEDFAVPAVFSSPTGGATVQAQVIFNANTETIFGDGALSNEYSIQFETASLPGLRKGWEGTVNGVAYAVREVRLLSDGKVSLAMLSRI